MNLPLNVSALNVSALPQASVDGPRQIPQSQLQRSADRIGRAIAGELAKLDPTERRELLIQTCNWIVQRVKAWDASATAAGKVVPATADQTQAVAVSFGKGTRSQDGLDAEKSQPKCTCRTVYGFQGKAVGMDRTGCQVHGLTLREAERDARIEHLESCHRGKK